MPIRKLFFCNFHEDHAFQARLVRGLFELSCSDTIDHESVGAVFLTAQELLELGDHLRALALEAMAEGGDNGPRQ
jgi:hypothetical protein